MKTAQGKLAALALILLIVALLLPLQSVRENALMLSPQVLKMSTGMQYALKCYLHSADADAHVTFESSNPRVAVVTADGNVVALDSGETVITAQTDDGARARTRVQVEGVALSELALNTAELRLEKGEISGLRAIHNEDATDARLKWISEDESIARVDASGRVVGVGGGVTRVLAIAANGRYAAARVTVEVPATAVRVTPTALTLGVGAKTALHALYLPANSTETVRGWITSDPRVLSVSADGEITALSPGSAHVSALTRGGLSAGIQVTVEESAAKIALNPSVATIERGDETDLQLALMQPDGSVTSETTHLVEWMSSAPEVASVDQNGHVVGLTRGTSRITAVTDGMTAVCDLRVEARVHEILLDETEIYLLRKDTTQPLQIVWHIEPQDADDPSIVFTTNNAQVAEVDSNGLVTLTTGYGTAVITLTAASGVQAQYTVNVVTELPKPTVNADSGGNSEGADLSGDDFGASEENSDADFGGDAEDDVLSADFFSVSKTPEPTVIVETTAEPTATPQIGRSVG